jgi:hypothetical protein
VADRPEALRLFDLEPRSDSQTDASSQRETASAASRSETISPSRTETPAVLASHDETPTETHPLQSVSEAAKLEAAARARLADAVAAALVAGHSWRALGIASGIPHQTLHRRFRRS